MTALPGPSTALTEGSVIGQKYKLETLLGEGGMGSVWRAFNLQLEVPVAIKVLRADLAASELGERLRVEARAAAKLVHPSIVRVFDIGETETNDPFIVMELLSGESLGSRLDRGSLSAVEALQLMLPIAEALSLAHARGVVHRDLKPDNIFLASDGSAIQPKLLDFGIAKLTSAHAGGPTLTQSGTLLGSPEYMSPEQAYGRDDIDHRSDVWAFCVVLYEAIAGIAPFGGESNSIILRSVVQDDPVPVELLAKVDPVLSAFIHWGLAKEREARPNSMFELARRLAAWLVSQGVKHDITGASLETKWLGSSAELNAPGVLRSNSRPYDQATLVSVANPSRPSPAPSPSPSDAAIELPPLRREKRWVPLSAGLALLALAIAWGLFNAGSAHERLSGVALPAALVSPTPAATRLVSATESVPVEALPIERPTPKPAPSVKVEPAPASRALPAPARAVREAPLAKSLPRALPRAPVREKRTDLLDPY
jgi:serine/threonine-protein kinase